MVVCQTSHAATSSSTTFLKTISGNTYFFTTLKIKTKKSMISILCFVIKKSQYCLETITYLEASTTASTTSFSRLWWSSRRIATGPQPLESVCLAAWAPQPWFEDMKMQQVQHPIQKKQQEQEQVCPSRRCLMRLAWRKRAVSDQKSAKSRRQIHGRDQLEEVLAGT